MAYDLIILGAGPAGSAAAVYAARKRLKTVLIAEEFGGQSIVSPDVQNWIGTASISGVALGDAFKKHVEAYAGDVLDVKAGLRIKSIEKKDGGFAVATEQGESFEARALLITTGASRRKLKVPGAEEFENKGVVYCASCDGPLFTDKDVVVVGGGNAGFETAAQLLAYTKSVTLLQHSDRYKADAITAEKVLANSNMTGVLNAEIKEIRGDVFVTSVVYTDTATGEDKEIQAGGVFVEIGLIPNTSFVEGVLDMDEYKRIIVDPWTQRTSVPGIWAAGDATNVRYHQNNIAAGDAVKALEDIYLQLNAK
ncbi:FAD-dependent oxidoreductase [Candidatus Wolfebacteria bacterium]|nr:FAD-dependent oxidoreductase [Candidatus Wolfebacteria bacterium]